MNDTRVLLVEDDAATLLALTNTLQSAGFVVDTAKNGAEGLAAALEKKPHAIITDLKMPIMSGLEMIRELRKNPWGAHVQVIVLSNVSDVTALEEAVSQGAFHYFVKGDTDMRAIVDKVHTLTAM